MRPHMQAVLSRLAIGIVTDAASVGADAGSVRHGEAKYQPIDFSQVGSPLRDRLLAVQ